ncbi:hypothetical protein VTI74DRAFT_7702 [Chaetomium olivicolor]
MRPSALLPSLFASLSTAYTPLSNPLLQSLPTPSDVDFSPHNGSLLAPLLIPRVPGTPGQRAAQAHFTTFFQTHLPHWEILWQNSTSTTPLTGDRQIPFANLILRREPPWTKGRPGRASYLTLVAHYDSKVAPEGFVGATDSAAPCAVLMDVARNVEAWVSRLWAQGDMKGTAGRDEGVQILFVDGEEAWESWTEKDSLYGSRSLAAEWENTPHPAMSTFANPLRQISLFVLLDLLGAPNPQVPSYFQGTHWAYQRMAALEGRMRQLGMLESKPKEGKPFFPDASKMATAFDGRSYIGDDHVPFMDRGTPILHLIPSPFPDVWHTMQDDGDHLDIATVKDWVRIVTAFTLEWMDVQNTRPGMNHMGAIGG